MEKKLKVFMMGGDRSGWALDTELRLGSQALEGIVERVERPEHADVLHTVWPEQVLEDPRLEAFRTGKPMVASFSNDPYSLFEQTPGLYDLARGWYCVGQSSQAVTRLKKLGIPFVGQIPYAADLETFKPTDPRDARLAQLRKELKIPESRMVIGSFQRDSRLSNLLDFKPQKGADILLAMIEGLKTRVGSERIHVLLAGPRRHWLREHLGRIGVSHSFAGEITTGDDYPKNILSGAQISLLTGLIDIYVVSSRWEGGPRAVMETASCRRPIISTPVGVAEDLLDPECIFNDLSQGIELLESHCRSRALERHVSSHAEKVHQLNSVQSTHLAWKKIYSQIEADLRAPRSKVKVAQNEPKYRSSIHSALVPRAMIAFNRLRKRFEGHKTITIWGELVDGPYGGASQMLKALKSELDRRGFQVLNNDYHDSDAHILNSSWFDEDKARQVIQSSNKSPRVLHRIDGPISLYRGKDRDIDEKIFALNRDLATVTAFQGAYSWYESLKMGFSPKNPVLIRNACDPALFYPPAQRPNIEGRKVRLISSSWSTNLKKGFETYQFLDEHLDFNRFDYTFVGRSPIAFKNIRLVDALPSRELGAELRKADIYIGASLHDPASNALLEAITSGLPVLYADSGGHSEFTWFGGLPFKSGDEIPVLLDKLIRDFPSYQTAAYAKTIREVADGYLLALGLT